MINKIIITTKGTNKTIPIVGNNINDGNLFKIVFVREKTIEQDP